MSRAKYLKSLQREFQAMQEVVNELLRENHELKSLLTSNASQPKPAESRMQLAA